MNINQESTQRMFCDTQANIFEEIRDELKSIGVTRTTVQNDIIRCIVDCDYDPFDFIQLYELILTSIYNKQHVADVNKGIDNIVRVVCDTYCGYDKTGELYQMFNVGKPSRITYLTILKCTYTLYDWLSNQ